MGIDMKNNEISFGGGLIRKLSTLVPKLLALNFLTLLCCVPVVTAGASFAALHDCLMKIIREDDDQLGRQFMRSFRANLKQATLLWLPFLLIFAAALADAFILIAAPGVLEPWVAVPAVSAALAAFLLFQFVMPLQARFENTPLNILRFAAILCVSHLPRTLLMAVLWAAPVVLFLKVTLSWPLVVMFGLSLPGYLCAKLYRPVFLKLEENMAEEEEGL